MNSVFEKFNYIYEALSDKKGDEIVAMNLGEIGTFADIFVIVTANSDTHMRTLVNAVDDALLKNGIRPHIEGEDSPNWRLVDGGEVLVHVFSRKGREFYKVEKIWGDAEMFRFESPE